MTATYRSAGLVPVRLHKRSTFNELINQIVNDKDKITYPERFAKQLRNSFELSQLDGEGMRQMKMQQTNEVKEQKIHKECTAVCILTGSVLKDPDIIIKNNYSLKKVDKNINAVLDLVNDEKSL